MISAALRNFIPSIWNQAVSAWAAMCVFEHAMMILVAIESLHKGVRYLAESARMTRDRSSVLFCCVRCCCRSVRLRKNLLAAPVQPSLWAETASNTRRELRSSPEMTTTTTRLQKMKTIMTTVSSFLSPRASSRYRGDAG